MAGYGIDRGTLTIRARRNAHPERAGRVVSQVQPLVVILYKHALLGEGIAEHLRAQLGVEAMIASEDDPQAVTSTLGLGPAVVIFEMGDTLRQFDLPLSPRRPSSSM